MPIQFKSKITSSGLNNTFLDKTQNDTYGATLTLNDSDVASGDTIGNLQLRVNQNTSFVFAETTKVNNDTITINTIVQNQEHTLVGDGSAVELNALPFGSGGAKNGALIYIFGGDDTNTVKLIDNRLVDYGCVLNGSATLGEYDCLVLKYNETKKRYIEISRNF